MNRIKRRLDNFAFYDFDGIARHLEQMASQGWLLTRIRLFWWEYRQIPPGKYHFAVTYFSEASDLSFSPSENQQVFWEYCRDAGWKLTAQWSQMQIFYSSLEHPVPIETDEAVRFATIHRSMKKNFLPGSILLVILALLQLFIQFSNCAENPVKNLSNDSFICAVTLWSLLLFYYLLGLTGYALWFWKSKRALTEGGRCEKFGSIYRWTGYIVLPLSLAIASLWMLRMAQRGAGWMAAAGILTTLLTLKLTLSARDLFKKLELPAPVNAVFSFIICMAALALMTALTVFGVTRIHNTGWGKNQPPEIYTFTTAGGNSIDHAVYRDPLPLTADMLTGMTCDHCSNRAEKQDSILLKTYSGRQEAPPDGAGAPTLSYMVLESPFPAVYSLCKEQLLKVENAAENTPQQDREYWKPVKLPGCDALEIYQLYYGNEPFYRRYVACWPDRLVSLRLYWEADDVQALSALEILRDFQW